MGSWQDTFADWAQAWAASQDLAATVEGSTVLFGNQHVMVWPGQDIEAQITVLTQGSELVLITEDAAETTTYALSKGLVATSRAVLLQAQTDNLDLAPHLPAEANLAEAPMENYDLVELAVFDHPVGRGRLSTADELAVVAELSVDAGYEDQLPVFENAIVAGLGDEAFAHGADTLYLVAGEEQAQRFAAVDGWNRVAQILSFRK
ncbi:hypothetical protein [Arthrobacter sp. lap29]|uniref:hypothetical protein n=1 Tax=Arthrobacter sp. lap29 TaxID=3056122 RepID=UPI0028F71AB1|nr:hypothetical protein [Arthrobacter sp. lap29]